MKLWKIQFILTTADKVFNRVTFLYCRLKEGVAETETCKKKKEKKRKRNSVIIKTV